MISRRSKLIGAVLCFAAIVSIAAWPVWKWISPTPANAALFARTQAAVEKNPHLKPMWDEAMRDGVLSREEAKAILEKAGEKAEPEQ
jgi:hypothetical protein